MKKLGFGCMRLPTVDGDNSKIDLPRFKQMVDLFQSRGFSYYDTAYVYHGGKSEEALREALVKRYPRDAFTVTTKMPMFRVENKEDLPRIFDEQLQRLGVDFIDYYWLHALKMTEYEKAQRLGAFEFISKKKAEGKIKHIGFSFHDSPEVLERILNEHPETEYVQLQINYIDWESPNVRGRECYEIATRHNKPVIVMEPVKGGALANLPQNAAEILRAADPVPSQASWAVRYAASLGNVFTVLSGMSSLEQVDDNTAYMCDFKPLDDGERQVIHRVEEAVKNYTAAPCTACRYCVDGCPKKIDIPDYLTMYNELKRMAKRDNSKKYYHEIYAGNGGKPGDCVACGKCEGVCPQHLAIRGYLKELAGVYEKH